MAPRGKLMVDRSTPWKVYVQPPRPRDAGHWQLRAKRRKSSGKIEERRLSSMGDEAEAERLAPIWERDLNSGTPCARASLSYLMDARIADLEREARHGLKSVESASNFRVARDRLAPLLGGAPAEQLTARELLAARAKLLDDGVGPEACNTYFRRARASWGWAVRAGMLSAPWPGLQPLPKGPAKKRPLKATELRDVLEWVREHEPVWYPLLALIEDSGRRVSEVCRLKGRDLDRAAGEARVIQKGNRVLVVPVSPEVLAVLPAAGPNEWLFPRKKIRRTGGGIGPARRDSVLKVVKRACKALGLDAARIDTHSFRRSAASHGTRAGLPNDVLRRLTGHETAAMLEHYQRETVGDDLRAAQAKLRAWRVAECVPLVSPNSPETTPPGTAEAPVIPGLPLGVDGLELSTSSLSGASPSAGKSADDVGCEACLGDTTERTAPNRSRTPLSIKGTLSPRAQALVRQIALVAVDDPLEALDACLAGAEGVRALLAEERVRQAGAAAGS